MHHGNSARFKIFQLGCLNLSLSPPEYDTHTNTHTHPVASQKSMINRSGGDRPEIKRITQKTGSTFGKLLV